MLRGRNAIVKCKFYGHYTGRRTSRDRTEGATGQLPLDARRSVGRAAARGLSDDKASSERDGLDPSRLSLLRVPWAIDDRMLGPGGQPRLPIGAREAAHVGAARNPRRREPGSRRDGDWQGLARGDTPVVLSCQFSVFSSKPA